MSYRNLITQQPAHADISIMHDYQRAAGWFAGYASVFHVLDHDHDVILPNAFTHASWSNPPIALLSEHEVGHVIGEITLLAEDRMGLYMEGELALEHHTAKHIHQCLKYGKTLGLSIGYKAIAMQQADESSIRYLTAIELHEVSIVRHPCNPIAYIRQTNDVEEAAIALSVMEEAMAVLQE